MVIHPILDRKKTSIFISSASAVSSLLGGRCSKCGFSPEKVGGMVKTCLDCFREGHDVYVFIYEVPIALFRFMSTSTPLQAEQVVQRAIKLYEEKTIFGDYNIVINNCEHFATSCKTDSRISKQSMGIMAAPLPKPL